MWTTDWLYTIATTSVIASVMALAILLVRTVFRRSLPKKALFVLWVLVLIKLVVPFQLPSPTSLYNVVDIEESVITTPVNTPVSVTPEVNSPADSITAEPSVPDTPVNPITPETPDTSSEPITPTESALSVTAILGWVHIGVAGTALLIVMVIYALNHYRLRKAITVTPPMEEIVR